MTNLFFLILLVFGWPAALIAAFFLGRSKKWGALAAAVLFIVGYPALLALNLFCDSLWPCRLMEPSPTGEYTLEQRYTDFLSAGYRGRTYLVAEGKRCLVDDVGPGGVEWLSNDTFRVYYFRYEHIYSVSDFILPS